MFCYASWAFALAFLITWFELLYFSSFRLVFLLPFVLDLCSLTNILLKHCNIWRYGMWYDMGSLAKLNAIKWIRVDSPISMVFERFERFKSTRLKGIRDESSKRWAECRRIENESGSRRNYVGASRCFRFFCFRCIFDSLPCDRNGLTSMLQKAEATQSNACCSTFCPCLRQFVHCAHIILSLTGRLCQLPVWEQSWKVEISFVIPSNWLSAPEVILQQAGKLMEIEIICNPFHGNRTP